MPDVQGVRGRSVPAKPPSEPCRWPPPVARSQHPARSRGALLALIALSFLAGLAGCAGSGKGTSGRASTTTVDPRARLAAELAEVEFTIDDPSTPDAELGALGRRQQNAYRELLANPEWEAGTLAALGETTRQIAKAHLAAGKALGELNGSVDPDAALPHWRIVTPEAPEVLLDHYRQAEADEGAPWEHLAAIHLVETRVGRIQGDSSAGARGPMQFIPTTWDIYGEGGDITSTADAIPAAARLLTDRGAPSDMASALHAYNPSDHYVRAVSVYAQRMEANPRAYLAYHAWQVHYGDRHLPEGTEIP